MYHQERGYTLIELMVVGTVMIVFAVTVLSFAWQQRAAERQHAVYAHDLLSSRAALDRIVADLRRATEIEPGAPTAPGVTIRTNTGKVHYTVASGELTRSCGSSQKRIAKCVAKLECSQLGDTAHVRLVLRRRLRRLASDKQPPALETTVALRLAAKQKTPAKETPKQETPKQETPKQETPKQETPKQETPKQETPKQETLKQETLKQETPKQETPKQEAPKQEAPKQEAPKQEAPKQETPKQETPEQETPKQGATGGKKQ
jgi:Tfp pilus assembly protein PilE